MQTREERLAQKRLYQAEWRSRNPGKDHAARSRNRATREFIFWDGESPVDDTDGGTGKPNYCLFGNSAGMFIRSLTLTTTDYLELILDTEREYPDAIHTSFGFNLDVSYILASLPHRQLTALHYWTTTTYRGFQIQHIPHKWFRVKYGKDVAKIFDIRTFCSGGYVPALIEFDVGTPQELAALAQDKARRSQFLVSDLDDIQRYWELELSLGPPLCEAIRNRLAAASYVPNSWHGPGAVARMAFARHKVYDAMADCPVPVKRAAKYAFMGGRFNQFLVGHMQSPVWEADIRSAYPYFATMLPNLARGKWRLGKEYEPGKFAMYDITYNAPADITGLFPLPKRLPEHMGITWPNRVRGWYWSPEAELVKADPYATFNKAWVFDEDDPTDRPFAFLREYYQRRADLKRRGDPMQYAFKIIINAIYGQLAQRAGWNRKDRKPPKTHQLEWAGFITSGCRAAVHRVAMTCGDKLVSINTDSVQALCRPPVDEGLNLGQWEVKEYSDGVMWQAGFYFLREELGYDPSLGYGWTKQRSRGIPKNSYSPEDLITAMNTGEALKLTQHEFIGYTLADNGRWSEWNTWVDTEAIYIFGGRGLRSHSHFVPGSKLQVGFCRKNCTDTIHRTALNPFTTGPLEDIWSTAHHLPWEDEPDNIETLQDEILTWILKEREYGDR